MTRAITAGGGARRRARRLWGTLLTVACLSAALTTAPSGAAQGLGLGPGGSQGGPQGSAGTQGGSDARLSGRVVDSAGKAVAGALVAVGDRTTAQARDGRRPCVELAPTDRVACEGHVATARTDADGRWTLTLEHGTPLARTRRPLVRVTSAERVFQGQTPDRAGAARQRVPTVRLWSRVATVTSGDSGLRFAQQPPAGADPAASLRLSTQEGQRIALAWVLPFERGAKRADLDPRILERADWRMAGDASGTWQDAPAAWTGSQRFATGDERPSSHGGDCWTYDESGDEMPFSQCFVTNGRFGDAPDAKPERARARVCGHDGLCDGDQVVVDLGSISQPSLVLLRSCSQCTVQLSYNRSSWTEWSNQQQFSDAWGFSSITGGSTYGRFLRVSGAQGLVGGLAEVSVWTVPGAVDVGVGTRASAGP